VPGSSCRGARGALRVVLLVVVALAVAGCQMRTEVNLTVEADGSGVVEVGIGLDEDGVGDHPDLLGSLEFRDLVEAGWQVTEPVEEGDGFTFVRVSHEFSRPEQVGPLVEQVAGEDGPFQDFRLGRDDAYAETEYRFDGVVDFTGGVDALAEDPELAEALGNDPVELIEERLGRAVDELLQFQVAVRLPGDVSSNAPTQASNGALWRPSVLEEESIELSATSTVRRTERLVWSVVAVLAGFALLLFVLVRVVAWRRSRTVARGS
jgi:hypothetical protein